MTLREAWRAWRRSRKITKLNKRGFRVWSAMIDVIEDASHGQLVSTSQMSHATDAWLTAYRAELKEATDGEA